jgi:uncharacterized protein (DUF433 family)
MKRNASVSHDEAVVRRLRKDSDFAAAYLKAALEDLGTGRSACATHGLTIPHPQSSVRLMDYRKYITIEPGKRGGKPCIRGMRITVYEVLDYLASGMTEAEILADFPDLTAEDLKACLAFAADRERKLVSIPS